MYGGMTEESKAGEPKRRGRVRKKRKTKVITAGLNSAETALLSRSKTRAPLLFVTMKNFPSKEKERSLQIILEKLCSTSTEGFRSPSIWLMDVSVHTM